MKDAPKAEKGILPDVVHRGAPNRSVRTMKRAADPRIRSKRRMGIFLRANDEAQPLLPDHVNRGGSLFGK